MMKNIHSSRRSPRIAWRGLSILVLMAIQGLFYPGQIVQANSEIAPAFAPLAGITLNVPSQVAIGASFSFTVRFDNTAPNAAGNTGFGPFIDLYFPVTGTDGNDGVDFVNAAYLSQAVTSTQFTFPGPGPTGCVDHPYAVAPVTGVALQVCGNTGDKLVVLQLPFGSFTPDQPAIDVTVNATLSNLADLNTPLTLRARGGYQFGATALQDWCCSPFDATILSQPNPDGTTWTPSASLSPYVLTVSKAYNGPESETATGPNYPRRYTVTADVASGQTITSLVLTDVLPNDMQFVQMVLPTTPAGASCTTPSTTVPGGTLSCTFASVTGGGGATDAAITFEYYIPLNDSTGAPVIDASSGNDAQSLNNVTAAGNWQPIDPRDPLMPFSVDGVGPEHTLTGKSIAIQKGVANLVGGDPYTPEDMLVYTLNFQVSDFFAFQNVVVTDMISDGQHFDPSFTPTLSVAGNSYVLVAAGFNAANYNVSQNFTGAVAVPPIFTIDPAANDGTSTILFRVSNEIITRGQNGRMIGGCVPVAGTGGPDPNCNIASGGYNDGPTTGTITFRTIIQDQFIDDFPSGDPSVDHGDVLDDSVTVDGDLLSAANTNNPTGQSEADTSAAGISIQFGVLDKSLYALNGSTSFTTPLVVHPGDAVTYRLRYTLPTSDFEILVITDFLPLPVLYATEITAFDDAGGFGNPVVIPVAGHVNFGPADTFRSLAGTGIGCPPPALANADGTPCMSVDAASNSVSFNYGNFDDPTNTNTEIDLLFTVTVSADPFADGLYLTNQAHAFEGTTNAGDQSLDGIVQIILTEPALVFGKSVVASSNPNAVYAPGLPSSVTFNVPGTAGARWAGNLNSTVLANEGLNSDVSGVEAGDLVSFALVVENQGTSARGAFDIDIRDVIPAGFSIPAGGLNLRIAYGDNSSTLAYTRPDNSPAVDTDLFAGGIRLVDPGGGTGGACQVHSLTSGRNVIVLTYDLRVDINIEPNQTIVNTGTLFNYSGSEGGPDFTTNDLTDDASVTIAQPELNKVLTGTETNNLVNSSTQAVIGEFATYTLTITIPQGVSPDDVLTDTLDNGLAFVDVQSVAYSAGVTSTNTIGTGTTPTNVTVGNANGGTGNLLTFDFGTITNSNTDNTVAETIIIVYRVVALNVIGNQSGTLLNNNSSFGWGTGNSVAQAAPTGNVTVIEAVLQTIKSVLVNGLGTVGDAGDPVQYTIVISHAPTSPTDAFDVTFSDVIPANIQPSGFTVVDSAGSVTAADFNLTGNTLTTVSSFDFPFNAARTITITVNGTLLNTVTPNQSITNTAFTRWTSLDGVVVDRSIHNSASDERDGSGIPAQNDYVSSGAALLTIANAGPVKSLVSTSEASTSGSDVAVGEIVRFRLAVDLPEGTSNNVLLSDTLQGGLGFIDAAQVRLSFIADTDMTEAADLAGADNDAVPPTFVLPSARISLSGQTVTFDLGNIVNNDSDAGAETVVLEYNAIVENIAANSGGGILSNTFSVSINGGAPVNSNSVSLTIREPVITFGKTIVSLPSPLDAGGVVQYRISYVNGTGATVGAAMDIHITDILPVQLALNLPVTVTLAGGAAGVTDNSAGNSLDVTIASVPAGGSVTVDYMATIQNTVNPGDVINNTSNSTWTSLSGAVAGERTGAGGVDNYAAASTQSITITLPVTITKQLTTTSASHTSGSNVTIGEEITYDILLTFSEGTTPSDTVVDDLPTGLAVVSGTPQVITSAASSGGVLTADFNGTIGTQNITVVPGDGGGVTFDFANVVAAGDGNTTNNTVLLRFRARVTNVAANVGFPAAANISNEAANQVGAGAPTTSNTVNVTVVEPQPVITKSFANVTSPSSGASGIVNDVIRMTLTYQNTGTSNAYDVVITDALDSTRFTALTPFTTPAGFTFSTSGANPVTVQYAANAGVGVAPGATIVFELDITLTAGNTPGDVISNTANVTQTTTLDRSTADGDDANERNATASASATLNFNGVDLSVVKDDGGFVAQPGDVIIYTLDFQNTGNIAATTVVVTETVPADATFNAGSSSAGWSCADGASAGSVCTYAYGTLAASAGDSLLFAVNLPAPVRAGLNQIANTASIDSDRPETVTTNNSRSDTTPVTAAPNLTITKDDGLQIVSPEFVITYTITVTNNGNQGSTGIQLVDTLPAGTTFVSATNGGSYAGGQVTWPLFDLASGASASFTLRLQVADGATLQGAGITSFTNIAAVQDDGSNTGGVPVQAQVTDLDQLASTNVKSLTGTNQAGSANLDVLIGEILDYSIRIEIPAGTINDLRAVDVLDPGLAFVGCDAANPISAGSLILGSNPCTDPAALTVQAEPVTDLNPNSVNAGRRVTFDFGQVQNNSGTAQTLILNYQVIVLDMQSNVNGLTGLNNNVLWSWEGGSLSGFASGVNVVEPELSITKSVDPQTALLGSTVTFTLEIGHTTASAAHAHDVLMTEGIPTGLALDQASLVVNGSAGLPAPVVTTSPTQFSVYWSEFALGETATITFQADFVGPSPVVNTANVQWSSLRIDPAPPLQPQSIYNIFSTERRYEPLTQTVNDYRSSASATLRVPKRLPDTGFAPNTETILPIQPREKAYRLLGDMWLEIPALNLRLSIVGIPATPDGWDLTWLANQAGYLEGTTFPSQVGTTGITAHVYLSDGKPGPFLNLRDLIWGDQVILHTNGKRYVYEVRESRVVLPRDFSVFKKDGYTWLTLITCRDYVPSLDRYDHRVAVRAVLVKIDAGP